MIFYSWTLWKKEPGYELLSQLLFGFSVEGLRSTTKLVPCYRPNTVLF